MTPLTPAVLVGYTALMVKVDGPSVIVIVGWLGRLTVQRASQASGLHCRAIVVARALAETMLAWRAEKGRGAWGWAPLKAWMTVDCCWA